MVSLDAPASRRQPFGSSPSRLDAVKRAAEAMSPALPADVVAGLVNLGVCGRLWRDEVCSSAQRGALIREVGGLAPMQGTPLADAILRAANCP